MSVKTARKVSRVILGLASIASFVAHAAPGVAYRHPNLLTLAAEGRQIFDHTPQYASRYVGNSLSCENCHLGAGNRPFTAPLWGAVPVYPRFQKKAHRVVDFNQRVRECFLFSEDGHAPPLNGHVVEAIEAYAAYLTYNRDVPDGRLPVGAGYVPPLKTTAGSVADGRAEFALNCSTCHGIDGQGKEIRAGLYAPPLWGARSFAQGAGMSKPAMAARFIWEGMPYGHGRSLSPQVARNIADFVDSHARPAPKSAIGSLWDRP